MHFYPERLQQVRAALMITKAEAARRLNISAMAYGRYEKGEREPSYQSVCYIAQTFHCNPCFSMEFWMSCGGRMFFICAL